MTLNEFSQKNLNSKNASILSEVQVQHPKHAITFFVFILQSQVYYACQSAKYFYYAFLQLRIV